MTIYHFAGAESAGAASGVLAGVASAAGAVAGGAASSFLAEATCAVSLWALRTFAAWPL